MKTPIQQLIERLETLRDEAEGFSAEVEAYQKAIDEAELFLEKKDRRMTYEQFIFLLTITIIFSIV